MTHGGGRMTEQDEQRRNQCDVDGCNGRAIIDILSRKNGYRCRNCMETDLKVRTIR